MKFDDRPDPAKRLEKARVSRGFKTSKDAATYFGWKYDTYAQHENGTRGLVRAADKYAKAFRVSEGWLLTGEGKGPDGSESVNLERIASPIGAVPVTGKVAANTWLSVEDMDFGYDDIEYVPSASGYPVELQFALKVEGNCLNKIANHGDRLICLDIAKTGIQTEDGDLVIVERSRFEGQMIERTAKRLRRTADGYELWPESTDPAHQEPITLRRSDTGDDVRIIGKVLWIMRKP
jgi:SOS-response transcriptional repressor LexA